jgi:Centromere protein B dimerisation domain.
VLNYVPKGRRQQGDQRDGGKEEEEEDNDYDDDDDDDDDVKDNDLVVMPLPLQIYSTTSFYPVILWATRYTVWFYLTDKSSHLWLDSFYSIVQLIQWD